MKYRQGDDLCYLGKLDVVALRVTPQEGITCYMSGSILYNKRRLEYYNIYVKGYYPNYSEVNEFQMNIETLDEVIKHLKSFNQTPSFIQELKEMVQEKEKKIIEFNKHIDHVIEKEKKEKKAKMKWWQKYMG